MDTTPSTTSDTAPTETAQATQNSATAAKSAAKSIKGHERVRSLSDIYQTLVDGVKTYFEKNHFNTAVIGVSGGVDSALTLKIAVDALGAENVTGLLMPEMGLTKQENIDHAKALCEFLGVRNFLIPINEFVRNFSGLPWEPNKIARMNTKARIRTVIIYNYANANSALVLGTSNKSEILLGYGTKFGDLAADIEVIGDIYKTEVVALADHIGLPPEISHKVPSAELSAGQTDEQELGASYEDMDKVLQKLDLGVQGCIEHGLATPLVQLVFRRVKENKHKSTMPPVIKVP